MQEWYKDFKEFEPGHRHMSHLYPLYPGMEFTMRETPEWVEACRRSLELRLEAGAGEKRTAKNGIYVGWSRALSVALLARLEEGERAHEGLCKLLELSTLPNLFDLTPAQFGDGFVAILDANFGGAAAMAEMLLQSHAREIHLLPALPKSWPRGSVRGLRARGNVEVDIAWNNGRAIRAELRAGRDGIIKVRPPRGQRIAGMRAAEDGTITLRATAGGKYGLTFS